MKLPLISGIYRIFNDGGCYVGSAVKLRLRWFHHRKLLRRGKHPNVHLQRAWTRDGEESFRCEVLELCAPESLLIREQAYLDQLRPKYNLNLVAASMFGHRHTTEAKAKISRALKGRSRSPEHRAALSRAWHRSAKAKAQNAIARARATAACIGRVESEETRRRKSIAHLGKKLGPDHRANVAARNRARDYSYRRAPDVLA
jgi:group I intron endonuclease